MGQTEAGRAGGAVSYDPSDTQVEGSGFRAIWLIGDGPTKNRKEKEDAAKNIMVALGTDRAQGQKSVLIH